MAEDVAGVLTRDAQIGLKSYWRDKRYAYDVSGNLIYFGFHAYMPEGLTTADIQWAIWKITYTDNNITRIEGPLTGAWDDRATLAWG